MFRLLLAHCGKGEVKIRRYSMLARPLVAKYNNRRTLNTVLFVIAIPACVHVAVAIKT